MDRLRAWLTEEQEGLSGDRDTLQLAVAALLMEAAQVDGSLDEQERTTVQRLLERKFRLSPEASRALAATGEHHAERSAQLFGFTRTINERVPRERRIELIEMLWEVAYADGALDPLEDAMLRQVGGLIDVADPERGAARRRVLQRLGIAEDS
ncbi:MAG TPA: TerB family tellurite resistance protein [Stellaceae bacterium]|nr:TerB family tellurite resistance protein [Stellaceae bacterium]